MQKELINNEDEIFTHSIILYNEHGQNSHILLHKKDFTKLEIDNMTNQAIKEMKWSGIKQTYGTIDNYMCDHFGFTKENRRIHEISRE